MNQPLYPLISSPIPEPKTTLTLFCGGEPLMQNRIPFYEGYAGIAAIECLRIPSSKSIGESDA